MPRVSDDRIEETRRRILDGARRAFAANGYGGATVRVLEQEIGLSRGAIFHHFPDKDALFLALAAEDAAELATVVAEHGLVQVMHDLPRRDPGWLGVQLEVATRLRTDPDFRAAWQQRLDVVTATTCARLRRGQANGTIRDDVSAPTLAGFLQLVHDGLVLHLARGSREGEPGFDAKAIIALAEGAVRRAQPMGKTASAKGDPQ
ncbi:MAG: TetR/AcrR family transcriptional regulator [Frankiaceae bacterium]